jgi:hypothetical protein
MVKLQIKRREQSAKPLPPLRGVPCLILYLIAPFKPFHPTGSIYYPAFTGEKGMALTAYFNLQLFLGGAGGEDITTGADYFGVSIIRGMNLVLHAV